MGEALAALGYVLLLHLAVGEGSHVFCALIAPAVYGKYLGILVGYNHGRNYYGDYDERKYYKAAHGQRVLEELAHTIPEEGSALAHNVLLPLFLFGGGSKLIKVYLHAQRVLFGK